MDGPNVPQGTPEIPTVKDGDYLPVTCANPSCAKPIQLQIPRIEVVNLRSFSSYHFSHEQLHDCPFCGQKYLFCLLPLAEQGMRFMFRPVHEKAESRIIGADASALNQLDKLRKKGIQ